jgi:hypothetical protein
MSAPKTITSFPATTAPQLTDVLLLETSPAAYQKCTVADLLATLGITVGNDGLTVKCPDGMSRTVPLINP